MSKEKLDEEQYKFKQFLLYKWDILKAKKQQWYEEALLMKERRRCKVWWTKNTYALQILTLVFNKFAVVRAQIEEQRNRIKSAIMIQRMFRRWRARQPRGA